MENQPPPAKAAKAPRKKATTARKKALPPIDLTLKIQDPEPLPLELVATIAAKFLANGTDYQRAVESAIAVIKVSQREIKRDEEAEKQTALLAAREAVKARLTPAEIKRLTPAQKLEFGYPLKRRELIPYFMGEARTTRKRMMLLEALEKRNGVWTPEDRTQGDKWLNSDELATPDDIAWFMREMEKIPSPDTPSKKKPNGASRKPKQGEREPTNKEPSGSQNGPIQEG